LALSATELGAAQFETAFQQIAFTMHVACERFVERSGMIELSGRRERPDRLRQFPFISFYERNAPIAEVGS